MNTLNQKRKKKKTVCFLSKTDLSIFYMTVNVIIVKENLRFNLHALGNHDMKRGSRYERTYMYGTDSNIQLFSQKVRI